MKERPILFSGPMVRAILEGRKTVTRRVMKHQPHEDASVTVENYNVTVVDRHGEQQPGPEVFGAWWSDGERGCVCPYGQPGDRLWVRESWWQAGDWQSTYPEDDTGAWFGSKRIVYSADGAPPNEPNRHYPAGLRNGAYSAAEPNKIWRHRPSIHMPRWACRILLEITAVYVERLQDISEEQAIAEGPPGLAFPAPPGSHWVTEDGRRRAFMRLWDDVNGAGAWDANPWVWVVEFKRVTP
ncbi:hypothetical protein A6723_019450 [Pseudomonas sp. AU11447]|uniref:hypothetical protein n=1 Tax=unclassified Pseudomonas TaxID=196821 RepID=UPI0006D4667D|nr:MULTISPECIES: hypothetical protein [unclassified Pseudomonas]OBY90488.1 hypothetical protein A6723_019450 [Pseudomonas sp. AU11447]